MKITTQDLDKMKAAVLPIIEQHPNTYETYQKQGMSDTRYNWDLLHASQFDICGLYHYMNDKHINTAIQHITGKRG